jgi:tRNA nucleotidyltransferase (CCA-adding enzyme)
MHRYHELKPGTVMRLLERLDGLRRPERVRRFALACEADHRGRLGLGDRPYPQGHSLLAALAAAKAVGAKGLLDRGLTGVALGEALFKERVKAIAALAKVP